MSSLDDRLQNSAPGPLGLGGAVGALLPLAGIAVAPPLGDAVLVGLSVLVAGATAWAFRRRTALLSLPLEIAPVAMRDPVDGRARIQVWLGRGRAMRDVSVTARVGEASASAAAAGPVVGPWTGVLDLPDGEVRVEARCTSGGREWTAKAVLRGIVSGRYAPPVAGSPGSLTWDRTAWGAPSQEDLSSGVQDM